MPRFRSRAAALLFTAAFALAGCKGKQMGDVSDKVPPPADPMGQYRATLATTCDQKHRETMAPAELRTETANWYKTLDAPAHDQYDKAVRRACKQNNTQPDCTNEGIITGSIEDGTLQKFVTQVCGPQS